MAAGAADRVAAALGPLHEREPAHPEAVQPGAHLARRERHEALRPRTRVDVERVGRVERGRAEPVGERELGRVAHAEAALLGGVDEEQAAERPPRLPAERRPRLLLDEDDVAARCGELGRRDQPGQAGPDDDGVGPQHALGHVGSVGGARAERNRPTGRRPARVCHPRGW